MKNPVYLLGPRFRSLRNMLAVRRNVMVACAWGLLVLGMLLGLYDLCVRFFVKIDDLDRATPVITALNTMRSFFTRTPTVGEMLNRTVLLMFLFSLICMLLISNVIVALANFFTSEELDLVLASPIPYYSVFFSKFADTLIQSSWMVLLVVGPFLTALGRVYHAPISYYFLFWFPLIPMLVFPCCIGIIVTLVLARVFPVTKMRNLMRFLAVMGACVVLLVVRVMRPELLVAPEKFRSLVTMLDSPWNPRLEVMPSGWASNESLSLMDFPRGATTTDHYLLWGGAFLLILFTYQLAKKIHVAGWQLHQEAAGRPDDTADGGFQGESPLERILRPFDLPVRAILAKDIRTFYRSPVLWTQALLMLVIMVIYLYNIYLLPIGDVPGLTPAFVDGLAFLNIGFVSFVVVALALRFGFPAVSLEGLGFFLIHSSPFGIKRYVRVKFWSTFIPLLTVSLVLALTSDVILGAKRLIFILSVLDSVLFSYVISALALGFGAIYHDFRRQSVSEIPSSFGGMVFMIATITVLGVAMALQAVPFWYYLIQSMSIARANWLQLMVSGACALASVVLCIVVARVGIWRSEQVLIYLEAQ
jgi:ABC-2 type transport system permease protein